ncbi:hypothetical protein BU17DRAFT_101307 [Hysterangium stoloniferum]|nr:hypothetical protein BU17DRAFT_101307 [Hysterangium stoloniferum]
MICRGETESYGGCRFGFCFKVVLVIGSGAFQLGLETFIVDDDDNVEEPGLETTRLFETVSIPIGADRGGSVCGWGISGGGKRLYRTSEMMMSISSSVFSFCSWYSPSSSPTTFLHSLSNSSSQGTSSLLPSLSPPIITIAIFALFTHDLPPRIEAAPLPAFFVFTPPFLSAIDAAVSIHLNTAPAADPLPLPLASNSRPAVRLQASVEFLLV